MRFRGNLLLCLAAAAWLGLLTRRFVALPLPGGGFSLTITAILLSVLYWAVWVDSVLRRQSWSGKARAAARAAWGAYTLFLLSPVLLLPLYGRTYWDALPVPVIAWTMTWYFAASLLAILSAVVRPIDWLRQRRKPRQDSPAAGRPLSRRRFLLGATAATPIAISGAAVAAGTVQSGRYLVRRQAIRLPRLPDRLRGLTITHLSDMHVGRLFRPEHLPRMVDDVNALDSDLVVITGDIVDHAIDFLPDACAAIGQLRHRYGRYVVAGNHDLIDQPRAFLSYMSERENLLVDQHVRCDIGGETIQIAGLFWSRGEVTTARDPGHEGRAAAALAGADPQRLTVALAHHPHAFDALASRGVDLTLAGHTHGGQVMFTPPGMQLQFGAGNLLFRYIRGEYRSGEKALFVSAGVGNWFPVRVNAPAEIVQLRLV